MKPYYSDEHVKLYLGDSREVLPALAVTADLVLADPPYEETSHGWDRWPDGWVAAVAAVSSSLWCFGSLRMYLAHGHEFPEAGWRLSHDTEAEWDHVVWEKHNGSSFATDRFRRIHEIAAHWYRGEWRTIHHDVPREAYHGALKTVPKRGLTPHTGQIGPGGGYVGVDRLATSVIKVHSMHGRAIHPHEKPIGIVDPLIRYACPAGGLVIDPFAGSCSTLDAARQSGRRAIGIEKHEPYAEKAARRLDQLTIGA